MNAEAYKDIALRLMEEWKAWLLAVGPLQAPQRAFACVDAEGWQFTIRLDGLPLDQQERYSFMLWLCRNHGNIASILALRVMAYSEKEQHSYEAIDVYSASHDWTASHVFRPVVGPDGEWGFEARETHVSKASDTNTVFNFVNSRQQIEPDDEIAFRKLWHQIRNTAAWQRRSLPESISGVVNRRTLASLADNLAGNWVSVEDRPGLQMLVDTSTIRRCGDVYTLRARFSTEKAGFNKHADKPFHDMVILMQFDLSAMLTRRFWIVLVNSDASDTNFLVPEEWKPLSSEWLPIQKYIEEHPI